MARNPGQAKRATAFAERLRVGIAVIHGDLEKEPENETSDIMDSLPQNSNCSHSFSSFFFHFQFILFHQHFI